MEGPNTVAGFRDDIAGQRFEQDFADASGQKRRVFADYAIASGQHLILHVEADPALRGSGAAGQFMQSLADHAKAQGLMLVPRCSYAVAWFKRHPDSGQGILA